MISVCMATYNGVAYIEEQVNSILVQLRKNDELIISDDSSTDGTTELLLRIQKRDKRVILLDGPKLGLIKNFENALNKVRGDVVFLADQDDVWLGNKVSIMLAELNSFDLIVSNCFVTDEKLNSRPELFFDINGYGRGVMKNIYKNRYLGCCMAFKVSVLEKALPFPDNIPMHDWWLGLIGDLYFSAGFCMVPTLKYRRHGSNVSDTAEVSSNSVFTKIKFRLSIFVSLMIRVLRKNDLQSDI